MTLSARRTLARRAGLLYFIMAIASIISYFVLPSYFIVPGDAAATASLIAANDAGFRLHTYLMLGNQIVFLSVVLLLFFLFRDVDQLLATFLVAFVTMGIAVTLVTIFNRLGTLMMLSGDEFLTPFSRTQLEALSYAYLRFGSLSSRATEIFWGLWLFPFGLLVIRSRFVPRFLGYLLLLAGVSYVLGSFVGIALPGLRAQLSPLLTTLAVGEVPIIFWLLIWGAREQGRSDQQEPAHPASSVNEASQDPLADRAITAIHSGG